MPEYLWDVKEHLLFDDEVKLMYDTCRSDYERVAVALMWRAAPRPMEMVGEALTPAQFNIMENRLDITLKTLKLGEAGTFKVSDRVLQFDRPSGLEMDVYVEMIIKMVMKTQPEQPILPYGKRWLERLCNRIGKEILGREITPYHFRHSRMTWLARNRATLDQLKQFKGAADYRSVWTYVNAQPFVMDKLLSRAQRKPSE